MLSQGVESDAPADSPDGNKRRSSEVVRRSRRKRRVRAMLRRRMDRLISFRELYRIVFVVLPIAGFFYVTFSNGVIGWPGGTDDDVLAESPEQEGLVERSAPESESADSVQLPTNDRAGLAVADASPMAPGSNEFALVSTALSIADRRDLTSFSTSVSTPTGSEWAALVAEPETANIAPRLPDVVAALPASTGSVAPASDAVDLAMTGEEQTYTINSGGSLWRTGRRFIEEKAILNAYIDTLAAQGMNVRNVPAGLTFHVRELDDGRGMLVLTERGGREYASRIHEGKVTSVVADKDS